MPRGRPRKERTLDLPPAPEPVEASETESDEVPVVNEDLKQRARDKMAELRAMKEQKKKEREEADRLKLQLDEEVNNLERLALQKQLKRAQKLKAKLVEDSESDDEAPVQKPKKTAQLSTRDVVRLTYEDRLRRIKESMFNDAFRM